MAVLLKDGSYHSRGYEEAGLYLSRLDDHIFRSNHHISFVAEKINAKFTELKNDYDSNIIGLDTYQQYLYLFKNFFDKYPNDCPKDLNQEIKKEIEKYWKE